MPCCWSSISCDTSKCDFQQTHLQPLLDCSDSILGRRSEGVNIAVGKMFTIARVARIAHFVQLFLKLVERSLFESNAKSDSVVLEYDQRGQS